MSYFKQTKRLFVKCSQNFCNQTFQGSFDLIKKKSVCSVKLYRSMERRVKNGLLAEMKRSSKARNLLKISKELFCLFQRSVIYICFVIKSNNMFLILKGHYHIVTLANLSASFSMNMYATFKINKLTYT